MLVFIKCFLYSRHCNKYLYFLKVLTLQGKYYYNLHFTGKETEAQKDQLICQDQQPVK